MELSSSLSLLWSIFDFDSHDLLNIQTQRSVAWFSSLMQQGGHRVGTEPSVYTEAY